MSEEIDINEIDLESISVEDDASKFRKTLSAEQMCPKYVDNKLQRTVTGMTEEEKKTANETTSPDEEYLAQVMKNALV